MPGLLLSIFCKASHHRPFTPPGQSFEQWSHSFGCDRPFSASPARHQLTRLTPFGTHAYPNPPNPPNHPMISAVPGLPAASAASLQAPSLTIALNYPVIDDEIDRMDISVTPTMFRSTIILTSNIHTVVHPDIIECHPFIKCLKCSYAKCLAFRLLEIKKVYSLIEDAIIGD